MVYETINSSYRGIEGIFTYVNDTSNGILSAMILLLIWVVVLVQQLQYGFSRALLVSSFIGGFMAVLMTSLGVLAPMYMYISFVIIGLAVIMVRLNHNA